VQLGGRRLECPHATELPHVAAQRAQRQCAVLAAAARCARILGGATARAHGSERGQELALRLLLSLALRPFDAEALHVDVAAPAAIVGEDLTVKVAHL